MTSSFRPQGGSSRGGFRKGSSSRSGESSRASSWQRRDAAPQDRPASLRLAGARADLERMLRELEDATKALSGPSVKIPQTSVLEHTKELELDAIFAPWRRVRAAINDVERAYERIDHVKFPKKGPVQRSGLPRRGA